MTRSSVPSDGAYVPCRARCGRRLWVLPSEDDDGYPNPYATLCAHCHGRYPASILKSVDDPFQYEMLLTSGDRIQFETADLHGDFIRLTVTGMTGRSEGLPEGDLRERGLDVAVRQIVWCRDIPS